MSKDSKFYREVAKELPGNDVLRYICLPDLLGKDSSTVLYIMGKNLARKIQPESVEAIIEYFQLFNWGNLHQIKEKRREVYFELSGTAVEQRFKLLDEVDYRLEAGFLAESMEQMNKLACECFTDVKPKKKLVQFNAVYTQ